MFNSSSPDELALVNAAKHFGFAFINRDEDNNIIVNDFGEEKKYKLLNVIEFSSQRKRMSAIVKYPDDRIVVMCKGADSIIIPRLKDNQEHLERTNQYLESFAKEGLRTLLMAKKEVSAEFYEKWNRKFMKASVSLHEREDKMAAIAE